MSDKKTLGKYTLVERIGQGGMAEVWRATLRGIDGFEKQVVIKKILPRYALRPSFIQMFVQEAKLASALSHANIVQIHDLCVEAGEYYMAMEYVRGWNLLDVLERASTLRRRIPVEVAVYVAVEVCRALSYAHAVSGPDGRPLDIVHMDVSPSNVLVDVVGAVKLADFGLARATAIGQQGEVADHLRGKLAYMSPEHVAGKPVDRRADLFAVGVILYELCTVKRLFMARTALETLANVRQADIEPRLARHPEIPLGVQAIIRKAVTASRRARYQTAGEMEDDLERFLFDARIRITGREVTAFLHTLAAGGEGLEPLGSSTGSSVWTRSSVHRSGGAGARRDEDSSPDVSARLRTLRFHLQRSTGSGDGPVTYDNLLRMLGARAVSPDEYVSVNGSDWVRVRDVPVLADVVARVFPAASAGSKRSGPFGVQQAIDLLSDLCLSAATGRLTVTRDQIRKSLYFRRGKVVHVTSNRKSELLGSFLVSRGVVTPEQILAALHRAGHQEEQLGSALVSLGTLRPADLARLLEEHIQLKFGELVTWDGGSWELHEGERLDNDIVSFELEPLPAMAEALRRGVDPAVLEAYARDHRERMVTLAGTPRYDVLLLRLTSRESRLLTRVSTRPRSVGSLVRELGEKPEDRHVLLLVLYLLTRTGHLRLG